MTNLEVKVVKDKQENKMAHHKKMESKDLPEDAAQDIGDLDVAVTMKNEATIRRRTERRVVKEKEREKKGIDLHAVEDSDATDASLAHKREKTNRSPQARRKQVHQQQQQHPMLLLKTRNIIVNLY